MSRVPFNHVRRGAGAPLVLIHGIGHHLQGWDPIARLLEDGFEVISVDTPGFGRSEPLPGAFTIEAYADAFAAWFDELGLDRPHVAGNSMGGGIGLELARRGRVRSVCANSPVGFWTEGERRFSQMLLSTLGAIPAPARPAVARFAKTVPGRVALGGAVFARPWRMPGEEFASVLTDLWDAPAFAGSLEAFEAYDFTGGDELDGTPVTVAWGSKDRLLLYGPQSQRARERLPNARHVTLPGLGHTPFFDDPGMLASVIRSSTGDRATL